jgi:hypothetical protein
MCQIEIGGEGRRDRRRVNLMIGQGFEAVDLEPEGRCRHVTLVERLRNPSAEWSGQFEALGLKPQ